MTFFLNGVFISIKQYKASDLNRAAGKGFGYLELVCIRITLTLEFYIVLRHYMKSGTTGRKNQSVLAKELR